MAWIDIANLSLSGGLVLLFALAIGHAIADFAFQSEFIAIAKDRHANLDRFFGEGSTPPHVWVWALGAHSLIHAGAVWLITGSVLLGAAEAVLHWLIDFTKSEGRTSFSVDQSLHLGCKLLYIILIMSGASWVFWSP